VKSAFPKARIIAEDLGELTPSVRDLRKDTGLPGMAILQFAFGGGSSNLYLPHNLEAGQILYPGTHDNDTTRGWYRTADEKVQDHVRRYLRVNGGEISWDFIRVSYSAVSNLAVIPFPDLLNLDSDGRLNTPGQAAGNWKWRYTTAQFERLRRNTTGYLRELGALYGRLAE
jgi:4-alpha-glucanotransferase